MAKRMFLVTEDQLRGLSSTAPISSIQHLDKFANELQKADHSVKEALSNNTESKTEKVRLIADAHDRYKNYISQVDPPPRISTAQRVLDSPENDAVPTASSKRHDINHLLGTLNKTQREKAQRVFGFLQSSGSLDIGRKNEAVFGDEPLEVSNLAEILHWITTPTLPKTNNEPNGLNEFLLEMKKAGAPSTLIANSTRRNMFENLSTRKQKRHDDSFYSPVKSARKGRTTANWAVA